MHPDLRAFIFHAQVEFLQGVEPHVGALGAVAAAVVRAVDKGLLRRELLHLVDDTRFRQDDELLGGRGAGVFQ